MTWKGETGKEISEKKKKEKKTVGKIGKNVVNSDKLDTNSELRQNC